MIQSNLDSQQSGDEDRANCVRRLREFENECRLQNPIPTLNELGAADRCRYELYCSKMSSFIPYSPWRDSFIGILHSDSVGLLAARDVFAEHLNCLVLLTANERAEWYATGDHLVDGWYWYLWWRIHTEIPPRFRDSIVDRFMKTPGSDYWILTHGRGSTSFHELWQYDGSGAKLIKESFAAICAEHGPIDEWYE